MEKKINNLINEIYSNSENYKFPAKEILSNFIFDDKYVKVNLQALKNIKNHYKNYFEVEGSIQASGGYGWQLGVGKSNRCIESYCLGMLSAGQLAKILSTTEKVILEHRNADEWHHTGSKFRKTHFYKLSTTYEIINEYLNDNTIFENAKKIKAQKDAEKEALKAKRDEEFELIYDELIHETNKAILISVSCRQEWFPTSQIKINRQNKTITAKYWLFENKFLTRHIIEVK